MENILKINVKFLLPTEKRFNKESLINREKLFNEKTLARIFFQRYYERNNKRTPIFPVREHPKLKGFYLNLDGHYRAIISDLFQDESLVFKAQSPKSKIINRKLPERYQVEDKELLKNMNENISWRFYESLKNYERRNSIKSFKELRARYDYLKDIETAKTYFEGLK